MATRKELFLNQLYWDTKTYNGFHFYDMDISMQVIEKGLKIQIIEDLLIEHKSKGQLNKSFYKNSKIFHQKWDNHLPIMIPSNIPTQILIDSYNKRLIEANNIITWYINYFYNTSLRQILIKVLNKLKLV